MIIHVVAYNRRDKALGANNKLLWHVPEDLVHFKNQIKNRDIYMGVNTYKSLLPFLNKSSNFLKDSQIHIIVRDLSNSVELLNLTERNITLLTKKELSNLILHPKNNNDFIIIGGGKTYEDFIPDKIIATEFDFPSFKEADTFYNVDLTLYKVLTKEAKYCSKSKVHFNIVTYIKIH